VLLDTRHGERNARCQSSWTENERCDVHGLIDTNILLILGLFLPGILANFSDGLTQRAQSIFSEELVLSAQVVFFVIVGTFDLLRSRLVLGLDQILNVSWCETCAVSTQNLLRVWDLRFLEPWSGTRNVLGGNFVVLLDIAIRSCWSGLGDVVVRYLRVASMLWHFTAEALRDVTIILAVWFLVGTRDAA
jgi:hypothetical protein